MIPNRTGFAQLPAGDRWRELDRRLPGMIAELVKAAAIPDDEEISLEELAARHGTTVRKLRPRLEDLGARPYRLGEAWMIRRKTYARALAMAEGLKE